MSVRNVMQLLYPPLLALHDLSENVGIPDLTTGRIVFALRDSHLLIGTSLDNGEMVIIWIGGSVSPQLLRGPDLFVDDLKALDAQMVRNVVAPDPVHGADIFLPAERAPF
ncbi:hypothetical protein GGX14DRAFT_473467, partial [Mycena pura]